MVILYFVYDPAYDELRVIQPVVPEVYLWTAAIRNRDLIYFYLEVNCA